MEFSNPIVGQEELIRTAIRSKNYVQGQSGWRLASDGSAEFSNVTIRADTDSTGFLQVYDLNGNLRAEITPDGEFKTYNTTSTFGSLVRLFEGELNFPPEEPYSGQGLFDPAVAALYWPWPAENSTQGSLRLSSAIADVSLEGAVISLDGPSADGNTPAQIQSFDNSIFADDKSFLWKHFGSMEITGKLTAKNRIVGTTTITPVANTPTSKVITFPEPLVGNSFACQVTANSTLPGTRVAEVSYSNLSANGVTLWIYRTDATTTTLSYTVEGF